MKRNHCARVARGKYDGRRARCTINCELILRPLSGLDPLLYDHRPRRTRI